MLKSPLGCYACLSIQKVAIENRRLKSIALEQIHQFSVLPTIHDPAAKIWRYVSWEKYFSLLKERHLFFPRADLFEDSFEGAATEANRSLQESVFQEHNIPEEQQELVRNISSWNKHFTFVSCWHFSEHESEAFWKIYGNTDKAVAIQSTYGALKSILPEYVHLHPVTYINYRRGHQVQGHSLYPFFYKREEFAHEKELRAVTGDLPISDPRRKTDWIINDLGWSLSIDLNKLIVAVVLAPKCSREKGDRIRDASRDEGLAASVSSSSLDARPRF